MAIPYYNFRSTQPSVWLENFGPNTSKFLQLLSSLKLRSTGGKLLCLVRLSKEKFLLKLLSQHNHSFAEFSVNTHSTILLKFQLKTEGERAKTFGQKQRLQGRKFRLHSNTLLSIVSARVSVTQMGYLVRSSAPISASFCCQTFGHNQANLRATIRPKQGKKLREEEEEGRKEEKRRKSSRKMEERKKKMGVIELPYFSVKKQ